jgi:gamma-glutamylaminecyclotransferase
MIPVFVYGTLKQGFGNHILLEYSDFVDAAILEDYDMRYSHGNHGFPVIFKNKESKGHIVIGEVYMVDQYTLKNLDRLESNGTMYNRKLVTVELSDGEKMKTYVYIGISEFWNNFEDMDPVGKKVHNWKR